jgi:hypothetical protein
METVKADDKRLVSYAVDLGTRITSAFRSESKELAELHARNGYLLTKTLLRERKTFTARNIDSRPKTLWIEHGVKPGFEPKGLQPIEKTADAWRFQAELEPGVTHEIALVFERVEDQEIRLSSMDSDELRFYIRNPDYDEAARERLESAARQLDELSALERRSDRLEDQLEQIENAQKRLRENIATLERVAGQGERMQRMADQLAANEEQIQTLRREIDQADEQYDAMEARIESELMALAF